MLVMFLLSLAITVLVFGVTCGNAYHPDTFLNIDEIVLKYGYPFEAHQLTTEDGYILNFFRIPYGRNGSVVNKKPILIIHGMLGQSENFVVTASSNSSLAFNLADAGYDVWLGNSRGNQHCMEHVSLRPEQMKFWDFSFHEIAMYDLKSYVDYILEKSGKKKLYYIGHSQGATVFFILNSMKPEYQKKFVHASLLAPAGYMSHFNTPVLRNIALSYKWITKLLEDAKIPRMLPVWLNITNLFFNGCFDPPLDHICDNLLRFLLQGQSKEIDQEMLPMILRFVSSISVRQMFHFHHLICYKRFLQYDHGRKKNLKLYGSPDPPDYPIENIKIPVALYYCIEDLIVYKQDVEDTCAVLANCTRLYLMPNPLWGHLDFIYSKNAAKKLHKPLIDYMAKYEMD